MPVVVQAEACTSPLDSMARNSASAPFEASWKARADMRVARLRLTSARGNNPRLSKCHVPCRNFLLVSL